MVVFYHSEIFEIKETVVKIVRQNGTTTIEKWRKYICFNNAAWKWKMGDNFFHISKQFLSHF